MTNGYFAIPDTYGIRCFVYHKGFCAAASAYAVYLMILERPDSCGNARFSGTSRQMCPLSMTYGKSPAPPVDKVWIVCGIRHDLCTTFAANPQVSALPHCCSEAHDVARFERSRHGPDRPVLDHPKERRGIAPPNQREGAGISRSPAPAWGEGLEPVLGHALDPVHRTIIPGLDLCPGCGHGRKVSKGG